MKKLQSSELMEGLAKGISADADGNVTVGKNLEVDGKTKLNGGFEPIHVYEFDDGEGSHWTVSVFAESLQDQAGDIYCFIGEIISDGYSYGLVYGGYRIVASAFDPDYLKWINIDPGNTYKSNLMSIDYFLNNAHESATFITSKNINHLYKHTLTVSGASGEDTSTFIFDAAGKLEIDSIQDLRTFFNIFSSTEFNLYGFSNQDLTNRRLATNSSLCRIWKGDGTFINVTSVKDDVILII